MVLLQGKFVSQEVLLDVSWKEWSEGGMSLHGDLPDPDMEPASLPSPALAGGSFTSSAT